jgi:Ca2+-transporting ATPase
MPKWHTLSRLSVLRMLKSSKAGLSEHEAAARLKIYGENKLRRTRRKTPAFIFIAQFASPLVILLLIATVISAVLGRLIDSAAIAAILMLNAALGFWQEWKAELAIEAMLALTVPRATVIRNGEKREILADALVPGDIVLLTTGQKVPADLRLLEAINLRINEAALTGESVPIEKSTRAITDVVLPERTNMAHMGTAVSYGRGIGIVVETGMRTEFGKVAELVRLPEEPTPLQRRLAEFSKSLGVLVIILAAILFALGFARGLSPAQIFFTAVALAISAVPEGLPAIVTVTLAIGLLALAKRKAIIRRLAAVEALGSMTVICADKTGTMTTNEMTVRQIWAGGSLISVTGAGFEPFGEFHIGKKTVPIKAALKKLLLAGALCNDAELLPPTPARPRWAIRGDPTEAALLVAAAKAGIKPDAERIDEMPFSSERKMMTTVNRIDQALIASTKGAPEVILPLCDLAKAERQRALDITRKMAKAGLRVLALAHKPLKRGYRRADLERRLTFLGLVGIADPPRPETKKAIADCARAGIRTVMITGDHAATALAIAADIGLKGKLLTGQELERMSDEQLDRIIENIGIFARISPEHKVRIVNALKRKGHVVAVTGDGVNDAPALRMADVGIAMGIKGTDVAKEASDMVLTDDNFATIERAVQSGRLAYDNIKKFIRFLLSVNFSEIFVVSTAILAGLPLPLLPLQILWINLVTDGPPALSLAADPPAKDLMRRKPRDPKEHIFRAALPFMLTAGALAFAVTFAIFLLLLPAGVEKARTAALTTTVMFQLFFVFNCRSERLPFYKTNLFNNRKLLLAIAVALVLHMLIIYWPPLQLVFGTAPLVAADWALILPLAASGLLVWPSTFMRRS